MMFKVGVEYDCVMDTIVDVKLLEIDRDDLNFRPRIWGRHTPDQNSQFKGK